MKHVDHVLQKVNSSQSAAQDRVSASWYRSNKKYGLTPDQMPEHFMVTENDLNIRQEEAEHLLKLASTQLDHLFNLVGSDGAGVFLTDKEGVIIDQRCHDANLQMFAAWGLCSGANWHEQYEGTNGIGTCIEEERNVIIHKDQHFMSKNTDITCIDAPIYGADGALIAALDISSARNDQSHHMNQLFANILCQTARSIETEIFKQAFSNARIALLDQANPDQNMLIAINQDDVVIGATRAARKSLNWASHGKINPIAADDIFNAPTQFEGFDKSERRAIIEALTRTQGNASRAAKILGIGRATLYRRMQKLGIARKN